MSSVPLDKDTSVHQELHGSRPHVMVLVQECLDLNRDASDTLDARRSTRSDAGRGPAVVITLDGADTMTVRRTGVIALN